MKNKVLLLVLSASSAFASAGDLVLPDTFKMGWLYAPDVLAEMSNCVPGITADQVEDIQKRSVKNAFAYPETTPGKTRYVLATGDKFACIDRSDTGKPILPPRIFNKTLRFEGASGQTTESLNRNLAAQLAASGAANALVKFSNGNAVEVKFSVAEDAPVEILYSTNFLKAGEFDEAKYAFVISDQIKSYSVTSFGSSSRHALGILQGEIAPRPLKGNHLAIQGNRQTAENAFEDSSWRFSSGGSISLAGGGVLSYKPRQGDARSGTWRLEDGALYLNYGSVYGSASLDKDGNLFVEFRNPNAFPEKAERRWTATLEK